MFHRLMMAAFKLVMTEIIAKGVILTLGHCILELLIHNRIIVDCVI